MLDFVFLKIISNNNNMGDFDQNFVDLNSSLIDEIICKVKTEGFFDQFRRECLADVDTKPAYQNLQHRVETSVRSFLEDQEWSPQMNKNQLREKLRKLITEKRFFETGIERIVDQTINPKLSAHYITQLQQIAYNFMGIERPSETLKPKLEIDVNVELPVFELEQVSPESDKSQTNIHQSFIDDLESPAFEPIEPTASKKYDNDNDNDDDMDISDGESNQVKSDEIKSNLSSISGFTSNDSNNSSFGHFDEVNKIDPSNDSESSKIKPVIPVKIEASVANLLSSGKITCKANELLYEQMNQDSILSQVSSSTDNNTQSSGNSNQMEICSENSSDSAQRLNETSKMQTFDEQSKTNFYGQTEERHNFRLKSETLDSTSNQLSPISQDNNLEIKLESKDSSTSGKITASPTDDKNVEDENDFIGYDSYDVECAQRAIDQLSLHKQIKHQKPSRARQRPYHNK